MADGLWSVGHFDSGDTVIAAIKRIAAYLHTMMMDQGGKPSTKRYGFLFAWIVVGGSWIANVVWHVVVDAHIVQAALGLGGVSGGGVALEGFSKLTNLVSKPVAPPPVSPVSARPDNPDA